MEQSHEISYSVLVTILPTAAVGPRVFARSPRNAFESLHIWTLLAMSFRHKHLADFYLQ